MASPCSDDDGSSAAVCCMCGDHGLPHELFRCNLCSLRLQHRYCRSAATCTRGCRGRTGDATGASARAAAGGAKRRPNGSRDDDDPIRRRGRGAAVDAPGQPSRRILESRSRSPRGAARGRRSGGRQRRRRRKEGRCSRPAAAARRGSGRRCAGTSSSRR
ncbi:hypothetical protein PAHAL_1G275800 [Panicum hallii]|uniref:PHD-type zinc finger plants domain-containing protein n=1 Tax=Panicum hallii TaxID=206008 RepID=A0A2T8KWN6_9POAL|nr:hypothetical protein PAHAL_1G275800 [Panicum hallii]